MEKYFSSRFLLEKAQILYNFVDLFSSYESMPRDYGTGELFSMTEIHLLNAIYMSPGITATELAERMHCTKGFVSRVLSKMDERGYIIRVKKADNAKLKELFVTAEGQKLCVVHNDFDERTLLKTYNYLRRDCEEAEIDAFYKVMQVYNNIMNAAAKKRKRMAEKNTIDWQESDR